MKDQSLCIDPVPSSKKPPGKPQECLEPRKNETYLQVYNCEFIHPPKPERFSRAMKQIYRTDYVQSHFVHYSTVTKDISRLRSEFGRDETFARSVHRRDRQDDSPEVFLDEINQGGFVPAQDQCFLMKVSIENRVVRLVSPYGCSVGHVCPDRHAFR
jgi:hypothetical protein